MKITSLILFSSILAIALCRPANENDYEEEVAPAKPVRGNPLLNRRSPLNGRGAKTTTTTTTTTQAPKEEEDELYDEDIDGEEQSKAITTTTPAPKKLAGGIVRPFRTNGDLLDLLKKRREQASLGKTHAAKTHHEENHEQNTETTSAPKRTNSGRRKFNSGQKAEESQQETESAAPPSRNGRRFAARA